MSGSPETNRLCATAANVAMGEKRAFVKSNQGTPIAPEIHRS
jgi:hypothetical protein